jgi:hypothetical protein
VVLVERLREMGVLRAAVSEAVDPPVEREQMLVRDARGHHLELAQRRRRLGEISAARTLCGQPGGS